MREFVQSNAWFYPGVDKIIMGYKFKFFMNNRIQFKSHKL